VVAWVGMATKFIFLLSVSLRVPGLATKSTFMRLRSLWYIWLGDEVHFPTVNITLCRLVWPQTQSSYCQCHSGSSGLATKSIIIRSRSLWNVWLGGEVHFLRAICQRAFFFKTQASQVSAARSSDFRVLSFGLTCLRTTFSLCARAMPLCNASSMTVAQGSRSLMVSLRLSTWLGPQWARPVAARAAQRAVTPNSEVIGEETCPCSRLSVAST